MTTPDSKDRYISHANLEIAAEVAIQLNQPLLLTGEPGTGKTTYARHLACTLGAQMGEGELPLLRFETKSTSAARDLFYQFDNLRRFHAAHDPAMSRENKDYLSFNALGEAILRSRSGSEVADLLPDHRQPRQSVVLVDEIDKAPRDFPNDILNEIERQYFRIPELEMRTIEADPDFRPVVVLTSNSEKNLPDAFLRRCVFYHIPFPEKAAMLEIVRANLDGELACTVAAVDFFYQLRQLELDKPPATAELVGWLKALRARGARAAEDLPEIALVLKGTLGVLVKTRDDLERVRAFAVQELGALPDNAQY
ncbi:MAG: AAA family ATPase [Candidatus Accumulibacter sp.]|jgi:MoxR-like ATPase|uniref:AAA family ATPase n=1 Tax=Candidatus Accumulibacter necessarius TaxID=2954386 RepID=UPI001AC2E3EF|nr:AAA family ATPase [Candidatus Accumulibacter necessarius]